MLLTVNGQPREVPPGTTVQKLLELLGIATGPVAVELNRAVLPSAEHARHLLAGGDVLEIVHFVGGG